MKRRNKNIRRACDEIKYLAETVIICLPKSHIAQISRLEKLLKLTHRIKRTTWRGEKTETLIEHMIRVRKPPVNKNIDICPNCNYHGTLKELKKHECLCNIKQYSTDS